MIDCLPLTNGGASLGGILILAFAVRFAAVEMTLASKKAEFPDSELYRAYTAAIERGGPYAVNGDVARRAPGYPFFLAACHKLFGANDRETLHVQGVLGALACAAVFAIGRRLEQWGAPPGTATAAGVIAAIDPYAATMAGLVLSEALFLPLLAFAIALGLAIDRRAETKPSSTTLLAALLGLLAGAACLTRPSAVGYFLVAALGWSISSRYARRPALIATIFYLAIWAPYWIMTARALGAFVPTTTNVGESLFDGVGPQATGASEMSFTQDPAVAPLGERERDRHWRDAAIKAMADDPVRILRLAATKILRFWSPWPNEASFRASAIVIVTGGFSVFAYALAFVGGWRLRRKPAALWATLGPAAYFCALHALFVSSVRYRVPTMLPLEALAGAGAMVILTPLARRRDATL